MGKNARANLLEYLARGPYSGHHYALADALDVTHGASAQLLRELVADGTVIRQGTRKKGTYTLASGVEVPPTAPDAPSAPKRVRAPKAPSRVVPATTARLITPSGRPSKSTMRLLLTAAQVFRRGILKREELEGERPDYTNGSSIFFFLDTVLAWEASTQAADEYEAAHPGEDFDPKLRAPGIAARELAADQVLADAICEVVADMTPAQRAAFSHDLARFEFAVTAGRTTTNTAELGSKVERHNLEDYMSPTCERCFGLVADARGLVEYEGDATFVPALCQCGSDAETIARMSAELDVCAVAAVQAIQVIEFLQSEVERLETLIAAMTPGSRGNN